MIPISGISTPLALEITDRTRDRQISLIRDAPEHARGIESFRERIADVATVEQLVNDRELYVFVMKAFDLEDQVFGKALMRRMLESDLDDRDALVNRLTDPRFREPVYQEVGKWLKGVYPISTGLVVAGLGQPEWLMEIDVIAVIPDD